MQQIKNTTIYRKFFADITQNMQKIWTLSWTDCQTHILSNWVWTIAQPVLSIASYFFVFGTLLRFDQVVGTPYLPWLLCSMAPWLYFQQSLKGAIVSLHDYAPLWRSGQCPSAFIPIVRVLSAQAVQIIWLAVAIGFCIGFGVLSSGLWMLPYYILCGLLNAIAQAYCAAAFAPFFTDLEQGVAVTLTMTFWFTPIVWPATLLANDFMLTLTRLNPLYYIIEGTRRCMLTNVPMMPITDTIWFFMIMLALCSVGTICFARLEKQYREVI